MKILAIIILLNFGYTTQQHPDVLLINDDTIHLKSFPLEQLNLQHRPFGYTRQTAPNTSCWRGYKATWTILDGKLYLKKID